MQGKLQRAQTRSPSILVSVGNIPNVGLNCGYCWEYTKNGLNSSHCWQIPRMGLYSGNIPQKGLNVSCCWEYTKNGPSFHLLLRIYRKRVSILVIVWNIPNMCLNPSHCWESAKIRPWFWLRLGSIFKRALTQDLKLQFVLGQVGLPRSRSFQKFGVFCGDSYNKSPTIWRSTLGPLTFGNSHFATLVSGRQLSLAILLRKPVACNCGPLWMNWSGPRYSKHSLI